jgi:hypothetical protein
VSVWHVITVVGAEKALRAFVAGFLAGRQMRGPVLFGHDLGVGAASLSERVHDLFAAGSHYILLAPESAAIPVAAALRKRGGDADLRVESLATVLSAMMPFSAEVFSEELAVQVRSALRESLPPGVTVERFSDTEKREPDASGAALYAPEHSFTYRASGRLVGALPGVLEMRRRALDLEFVTVESITLETQPDPTSSGS